MAKKKLSEMTPMERVEQIMKEGIGAEAIYLNQLGWSITTDIPIEHLVKNGDKVKLIIFKEK